MLNSIYSVNKEGSLYFITKCSYFLDSFYQIRINKYLLTNIYVECFLFLFFIPDASNVANDLRHMFSMSLVWPNNKLRLNKLVSLYLS